MPESNEELVDYLKNKRILTDDRLKKAMKKVDRKNFVPEKHEKSAYVDEPLSIGGNQTISAPHMVALMTEALKVQKGNKVLEIGAGSGYQAAVLAEIAGPEGQVHTIERVKELEKKASEALKDYRNVEVHHGNGYFGYEAAAPFDRILVACGAREVPPPLKNQLKEGGKMVIPVGRGVQRLTSIEKTAEGLKEIDLNCPCRFVPFVEP